MLSHKKSQKAREKYGGVSLTYYLANEKDEDAAFLAELTAQNKKNLPLIEEALQKAGIYLFVEELSSFGGRGYIYISLSPELYVENQTRNAGRRRKYSVKNKDYKNKNIEFFKYSDVVFMLQTMKDQEVADAINMPIATFYRHKKGLKESEYYNSLDLNRLKDKEYLESVEGNDFF